MSHDVPMEQMPLEIVPPPRPSFESFLAGANAAALQYLRSLAVSAAPVYLWGPSGSGKTHLLRALASAREGAGATVGWFKPADGLPWTIEPGCGLLVIDDCHALDAARQHAAFALFIAAAGQSTQVAGAGRLPPVDLPLRDDLRTRLAWGDVFALQPLDEAQTRAALQQEAERRCIALADDVLDHCLTHQERDLGHLMALLHRLDRYALVRGRRITVPLVRQMLAAEAPVEASAA